MSNGYSELDPYGNYGDKHTLSPYEMLMQMKAWNKEIYLTIENNDEQMKTQLSVLDGEIRGEISDVSNGLQTQITANANGIATKVSQTDYNGNTVASLITQTPTAISAVAQALNLSGYVTFSSLTASGTTNIDGARITTGLISADRIQASTVLAKLIAAGGISADQITSGTISANRLNANAITTTLINAGGISASLITAGTISGDRLDASVIRTKFLQAGYIGAEYINGGTLSGVTLNVNTDATIGNQLQLGSMSSATGKGIYFSSGARIGGSGISDLNLVANNITFGGATLNFNTASSINWGSFRPSANDVRDFHLGYSTAGKLDIYRYGNKIGTVVMTAV